jgi:hypothetical protein
VFRADLYHLVARFTPGESGDARLRHFPSRSAAA